MEEMNWEEFEAMEIQLPHQPSVPKNIWAELIGFLQNALEKDYELMSHTSDILDQLYDDIGGDEEAATLVISYLQRRHRWDIELLAERRDVDDVLFREHNLYDDHMWDKVMNTKAISDLHHEVFKISQTYISRAVREALAKDGTTEQPAF